MWYYRAFLNGQITLCIISQTFVHKNSVQSQLPIVVKELSYNFIYILIPLLLYSGAEGSTHPECCTVAVQQVVGPGHPPRQLLLFLPQVRLGLHAVSWRQGSCLVQVRLGAILQFQDGKDVVLIQVNWPLKAILSHRGSSTVQVCFSNSQVARFQSSPGKFQAILGDILVPRRIVSLPARLDFIQYRRAFIPQTESPQCQSLFLSTKGTKFRKKVWLRRFPQTIHIVY